MGTVRVRCPSCGKWVLLNRDGLMRRHKSGVGDRCPAFGHEDARRRAAIVAKRKAP